MIEINIEWVLAALVGAGGIISTLATVIWRMMVNRLAKQDETIRTQGEIIASLQKDIERLSKGCGIDQCIWKHR